MSDRREHRWTSLRGIAGGLAMFVIESFVTIGLGALAWIVSVVVLAIL